MKVTVKEEIKGFSGKLSFGGTASAGIHSAVFYSALQRAPVHIPPFLFGATASAGTHSAFIRRYSERRYSERRYKKPLVKFQP